MSAATPADDANCTLHASDPGHAERALIERCHQGDVLAFDELVGVHHQRVFNHCYWMLGNRDDAADATQEAFVRAYRSLNNFRGDSALSTWLHRIATNVALDALQRRKRQPLLYSEVAPSGEDEHDSEELVDRMATNHNDHDPAQMSARRERLQLVRDALVTLPEHYRVALALFDIQGNSYEEIAAQLDLPLGTVKSRINRARLAMREKLQDVRELFET